MCLKKMLPTWILVALSILMLTSCGPKDGDIQSAISTAINQPEIMIAVEQGMVMISGAVASDEDKAAIEEKIKEVKGVKGIENNLEVVSPSTESDEENGGEE